MKFNKLFKRSILGDYDRDGVMNAFDCQPKNKRKQDSGKEWSSEDKKIAREVLDSIEKEERRRRIDKEVDLSEGEHTRWM